MIFIIITITIFIFIIIIIANPIPNFIAIITNPKPITSHINHFHKYMFWKYSFFGEQKFCFFPYSLYIEKHFKNHSLSSILLLPCNLAHTHYNVRQDVGALLIATFISKVLDHRDLFLTFTCIAWRCYMFCLMCHIWLLKTIKNLSNLAFILVKPKLREPKLNPYFGLGPLS